MVCRANRGGVKAEFYIKFESKAEHGNADIADKGGGGVMEMLTLLTRGGWGVIEILT